MAAAGGRASCRRNCPSGGVAPTTILELVEGARVRQAESDRYGIANGFYSPSSEKHLWFRSLPRRAGRCDRPRARGETHTCGDADGRRQVALLPAASDRARRDGTRHLTADCADARSDPQRERDRVARRISYLG